MKLHEIIATNDWQECQKSILVEKILPYREMLKIYYRNLFCCNPVLMVTSVFNAAQYGIIVPSHELTVAAEIYADAVGLKGENRSGEIETILFNSQML